MMRRFALAFAVPMAAATAAPAATFDFSELAAQAKAEAGTERLWSEVMPDGWTVDGITLDVSATGFLDGPFTSNGLDHASSGLGSCNVDDCNKSGFDGVRDAGEALVVTFDRIVDAVWTFRETTESWRQRVGPDHTLANGCARVNGTDYDLQGGLLGGALAPSAAWTFEPCVGEGFGESDYYISAAEVTPPSPVPLPAGALLLGTALVGLGLRARSRA